MRRTICLLAVALMTTACATQPANPSFEDIFAEVTAGVPAEKSDRIAAGLTGKPLGSPGNPVRVYMPEGQRAYLSKLRCADGRAPAFNRQGSAGFSPYGQVMDGYALTCPGSAPTSAIVYLDMYHPAHVETNAPRGFTLAD